MDGDTAYLIAADAILLAHAMFVGFVVFGLLLIFLGKVFSWAWVRNPWFRLAHLLGIGIVVAQSWVGAICPLTTWEMSLRSFAGESVYRGTFISHWLQTLIYYNVPEWIFVVGYTLFAMLVFAAWYWVRPRPLHQKENGAG
jgi:hypothetical protein